MSVRSPWATRAVWWSSSVRSSIRSAGLAAWEVPENDAGSERGTIASNAAMGLAELVIGRRDAWGLRSLLGARRRRVTAASSNSLIHPTGPGPHTWARPEPFGAQRESSRRIGVVSREPATGCKARSARPLRGQGACALQHLLTACSVRSGEGHDEPCGLGRYRRMHALHGKRAARRGRRVFVDRGELAIEAELQPLGGQRGPRLDVDNRASLLPPGPLQIRVFLEIRIDGDDPVFR